MCMCVGTVDVMTEEVDRRERMEEDVKASKIKRQQAVDTEVEKIGGKVSCLVRMGWGRVMCPVFDVCPM